MTNIVSQKQCVLVFTDHNSFRREGENRGKRRKEEEIRMSYLLHILHYKNIAREYSTIEKNLTGIAQYLKG